MIIKHKRYKLHTEINVVPFLDVLLILLLIFMMMPSQLLQGFEVNLPNSTVASNLTYNNQIILTIEIKESGLYNCIFNDRHISNLHLDQLRTEINSMGSIHPGLTCLVAAAKHIQYDSVIQLLNLLRSIGVQSVGMITNPLM